jgi:hypothetical protein
MINLSILSLLLMLAVSNYSFGSNSSAIGNTDANIVLISQGRPVSVIVIGQDAAPLEKLAAIELNKYIEIMTGVKLPIVDDNTHA